MSQQPPENVFRPSARLISMLGDSLISDQAVGLIELVKNAYDADATEVAVEIKGTNHAEHTQVTIQDNGLGMTLTDVKEKWLVPATDHKERQKQAKSRTALGRLPIGEKGVGRFAVQQLGHELEMITRSKDMPEVVVRINWNDYDEADKPLDSVAVPVTHRDPLFFEGEQTGTWLCIRKARSEWDKKLLSKVHRTLRRLQSPVPDKSKRRGEFEVSLKCPEYREFENIDQSDILKSAHYELHLTWQDGVCDLEYRCKHPAIKHRTEVIADVDLESLARKDREDWQDWEPSCGSFAFTLHVWDRDREYLKEAGISAKELDAHCGVSLFRDDLRILPYGEPGNDWLLLDKERIQAPGKRIGNYQVIGLVEFDQAENLELRDKTNREGLIENAAFHDLQALVRAAIKRFVTFWQNDRPSPNAKRSKSRPERVWEARTVATALQDTARQDVQVTLPEMAVPSKHREEIADSDLSSQDTATTQDAVFEKDAASSQNAAASQDVAATRVVTQPQAVDFLMEHIDETAGAIKNIENNNEMLLQLAATGLAAERVVHEFGRQLLEVKHAMETLEQHLAQDVSPARQAMNVLQSAMNTLSSEFRVLAPYEMVLRKDATRKVDLKALVRRALALQERQLETRGILTGVFGGNWSVRTKETPLLQILGNLIHNACQWVPQSPGQPQGQIQVLLLPEEEQLLVMDNGPGVDAEAKTKIFDSFFSTTDGKGMGLYLSAELAKSLKVGLRLEEEREQTQEHPILKGAVFVIDFANREVT